MTATSDALNAAPRSLDEMRRGLEGQIIHAEAYYQRESSLFWLGIIDDLRARLRAVEAEIAARGRAGMSETWHARTDAEIIKALDDFAIAQERMAASACEDRTHWHHVACAHLYAEAASRLRKAWGELHDERLEHGKLQELLSRPEIDDFWEGIVTEAAHQRQRWGDAHDRSKSAENWYWLVGYLSGKALRAAIDGQKAKAKHHTISSAAALFQWHQAIKADETGRGIGADEDISPEGGRLGAEPPK